MKYFFIFVNILLSGCAMQNKLIPIQDSTLAIKKRTPQTPAVTLPPPTPETQNNIWQRIFDHYQLQDINHPRITQEIQRYLKNPKFLEIIQKRAKPYLYLIAEATEKQGLPGELALLPIVESGFQPNAYSSGKAAGLWQFIPSTGRMFGLKQNWWYDGRRDVYTSTQAATRYLKKLNKEFDGDWLLTLASYNAGKGNVRKAIKKNKKKHRSTSYWSLPLPQETRSYVPRLLALARILDNAEHYNLPQPVVENKPHLGLVNIKSQLDLKKAAEIAQIPLKELLQLNAGLNRWCTPPDGPHHLLLPIAKTSLFKKNLAELPLDEWVTWQRHKITSGENLGVIALKYRTSVKAIREVNRLSSTLIRTGKFLLIPTGSTGKYNTFVATVNAFTNENTVKKTVVYTVKKNDNLWLIAQKFTTHSSKIARLNHLKLNSYLQPGQKLRIPQKKTSTFPQQSSISKALQKIYYTIRRGDSLSHISKKFNVSIGNLRKWNKIGRYIQPGQKLKLLINITQPSG
jgi:membrane-bound lytic murein transglycosylase D